MAHRHLDESDATERPHARVYREEAGSSSVDHQLARLHGTSGAQPAVLMFLQGAAGNRAVCSLPAVQRGDPPPLTAPAGGAPPSTATKPLIGHVYTVRGTVAGQPVVYTGSTAREIAQRLFQDKHTWSTLIKDKATTIEVHEIRGVLNVAESGEKTVRSATNEALRAGEQVIIKRRRTEPGAVAEKNARGAAVERNIDAWGERHQVSIGPRVTFRAGVKLAGFIAFDLLNYFLMYRDMILSQYVMTPYLLEDANGIFTLNETDRGIFRSNWYWKNYKTGPMAGQRQQISKEEFYQLEREAELLWGTTDWKGDFVPGLLRQELPMVQGPSDA